MPESTPAREDSGPKRDTVVTPGPIKDCHRSPSIEDNLAQTRWEIRQEEKWEPLSGGLVPPRDSDQGACAPPASAHALASHCIYSSKPEASGLWHPKA